MATWSGTVPKLLVADIPAAVADWQQIPGELTAASAARTSYSPTWTTAGTAPSLGNGSLTGFYLQLNKQVYVKILWVAGSTTTFGTSAYRFTLPLTPQVDQSIPFFLYDSSAAAGFAGQVWIINASSSGDNMRIIFSTDAGTANVTNSSPVTLATSDRILIEGWYETT